MLARAVGRWPPMGKPNYQFEKRRREMEKKAKKAEKQKRKETDAAPATPATNPGEA